MHPQSAVTFVHGIEDRPSTSRSLAYGLQHLLALTGIWIFPILIGQAFSLSNAQVGDIIQACFLATGVVTILQSGRLLKLPVVQGPTAAFLVAVLAAGQYAGLGAAYGSMIVAALIFMALSIPIARFGIIGFLIRYISPPIVYGTLLVIIGAQLASIGLKGWFGVPGTQAFGFESFTIGAITVLIVLAFWLFGRRGLMRQGALLWGIVGGTLISWLTGVAEIPDLSAASVVSMPRPLPFGFEVSVPLVILMLLAFLQASAEAMGMYTLLAEWGNQKLTPTRVNRGLFCEFLGSGVGAIFGGLGTTSYPENIGIIRISRIASRHVTMIAGAFAIALSFLPPVAQLIAGLPGPVLSAASTILFGTIAISGIQMLARIEWDEYNTCVASISFIVSMGTMFLPDEVVALFPASLAGIITQPMMVGVIMLVLFNYVINIKMRPWITQRQEAA